jgi:hypothetical protein
MLSGAVRRCARMMRLSRVISLVLLPLVIGGCAARITNLTPAIQTRSPEGMYPVEFAFESRQQSLQWETITPFVIVGEQHYPMTKVELIPNRWEGAIPVPPATNLIHYRFKVDFMVQDFGRSVPGSASSTTYPLKIKDE